MKIFHRITAGVAAAAAALTLSACAAGLNSSPDDYYKSINDSFGGDIIAKSLGEHFSSSASPVGADRSEMIHLAMKDIHINNSRFVLPVLVKDIPDSFSVEYGNKLLEKGLYVCYSGKLKYGSEEAADIIIVSNKRTSKDNAAIISMTISADRCKWSVGTAKTADPDDLKKAFGDPCSQEMIDSDQSVDTSYFNENGEFMLYISGTDSVMLFDIDCAGISENGKLCEYAPYEDFQGMTSFPELTGSGLLLSDEMALSDTAVRIGDFSCPPYINISDLGEDISLSYMKTFDREEEGYKNDRFVLLYKGRNVGFVEAARKESEPVKTGNVVCWFLLPAEELPCPAALAGIPCSQSPESFKACFEAHEINEDDDGTVSMFNLNTQFFYVYTRHSGGISFLEAEPFDIGR